MDSSVVSFWTAVAALASVFTVCVTAVYTYLTLGLLRSQAEPKVVLYVTSHERAKNLLAIVIKNIGHDTAFNISFTLSRTVPWLALNNNNTPMKGPLVNGIAALGPGDNRTTVWGDINEIEAVIGDSPVDVNIKFWHGNRMLKGYGVLECSSFKDRVWVPSTEDNIADSLKAVANSAVEIKQSLLKR